MLRYVLTIRSGWLMGLIEIGCGVLMLIEQADMLTAYSSYGEHGPLRILLQISR